METSNQQLVKMACRLKITRIWRILPKLEVLKIMAHHVESFE